MGANCCKRGEPFIPGEVLDRVIAEKSADDKCQLYDLANFRKSGILIEAFNNGGSKGVGRVVRIADWLYIHYRSWFVQYDQILNLSLSTAWSNYENAAFPNDVQPRKGGVHYKDGVLEMEIPNQYKGNYRFYNFFSS